MANVSLLVSNVVRVFTSPALPASSLYRPSSLCHRPFAVSRFSVDRPYSVAFRFGSQERSGTPWFVSCRPVLLDAVCDPGDGKHSVVWATCVSTACLRSQGIGPPNGLSGLFTGFSFYRFTSQPFLGSLRWIRVVDDSFPGGVRSRTTRDHFQVYGYNLPPLRGSISDALRAISGFIGQSHGRVLGCPAAGYRCTYYPSCGAVVPVPGRPPGQTTAPFFS